MNKKPSPDRLYQHLREQAHNMAKGDVLLCDIPEIANWIELLFEACERGDFPSRWARTEG